MQQITMVTLCLGWRLWVKDWQEQKVLRGLLAKREVLSDYSCVNVQKRCQIINQNNTFDAHMSMEDFLQQSSS